MPKGLHLINGIDTRHDLVTEQQQRKKRIKMNACVNKSHIISIVPFCAKESHFLPQILYWWDILATLCYYTMIK